MWRERGIDLLKSTMRPEWKEPPTQSMEPFETAQCMPSYWGKVTPGLWKYDKHAAYLAAMSTVKVGISDYERRTGRAALASLCEQGCYLVESLDAPQWVPAGIEVSGLGGTWLYLSELRLLDALGVQGVVSASFTYPKTVRAFYPFYELLRVRRGQGENVKPLYTSAFGMLAHEPQKRMWRDCLYRPDWHRMLIAEAKLVLYKQALQVHEAEGLWPIAMKVDALYYTQQVRSLRLGDGIGAYEESRT